MDEISINLSIEKWAGKFEVSDGEDVDYVADTLAEAYFYVAQCLALKSDTYRDMGLDELQERINKL